MAAEAVVEMVDTAEARAQGEVYAMLGASPTEDLVSKPHRTTSLTLMRLRAMARAATKPHTRYILFYRGFFDKMVFRTVVIGFVTAVVQIIALVVSWGRSVPWYSQVPCAFRPEMASFVELSQVTSLIVEVGTILPTIGFVAYGIHYLRDKNRKSSNTDWEPMSIPHLWILYGLKVLTPVLLYTSVNFKLPTYVPYEQMAKKACGVTASLALFPPGRDGRIIQHTYTQLRQAYSKFLTVEGNLQYPDFPEFELKLAQIANSSAGAELDESTHCRNQSTETTGIASVLNIYLEPPKDVEAYCDAGFAFARTKLKKNLQQSLRFPMDVLQATLQNLFAAMPTTYLACSRDMSLAVTNRPTPDPHLNYTQVCHAFHNTTTYTNIPPRMRPFISQEAHGNYSAGIRALGNETQRQMACLLVSEIKDPRTGYDGIAGRFCPPWLSFQRDKEKSGELRIGVDGGKAPINPKTGRTFKESHFTLLFDANTESVNSLAFDPFSTASVANAGHFVLPENFRWDEIALLFTSVLNELNDRRVLGNRPYTATARWTVRDPRTMAQLGMAHMGDEMITIYNRAYDLQQTTEGNIRQTQQALTAINDMSAASAEKRAKKQAALQTVSAAGKLQQGEDPENVTAAALDEQNDYWLKEMNDTRARSDVATQTQFGPLSKDTAEEISALQDDVYRVYLDLRTTSSVGMLKTAQLVTSNVFDATQAAIGMLRYVIGTYIGLGVISVLLPFSLAIVAGIKKGTVDFAKMTILSGAFTVPGDLAYLGRFNALLLFITGLVVAVPVVAITIFFYQAYTEQGFICSVLGVMLWVTGASFSGFTSERTQTLISIVSVLSILLGLVLEVVLSPGSNVAQVLLIGEQLLGSISVIKIVSICANAVFGFFFSHVVTAQLVSWLSSEMFSHGASGTIEYSEKKEDGSIHRVASNLDALNVWSKCERGRARKKVSLSALL